MDTSTNRVAFNAGDESVGRRRNRVLPSAEDMYIRLTSEQLDLIGRSRLIQDDTEYSSSVTCQEDTFQISYGSNEEIQSTHPSRMEECYYDSEHKRKKKIIHPEPELSNPHHIPFHLRDTDGLNISSGISHIIPQNKSFYKNNSWRGFSTYSATQNRVNIVTMRQFFEVHRRDSLFEYVFTKFRDQIALK